MALSTKTTVQRRGRTVIPPTMTLAVWRLRKTWGLLLITGIGMVAAVMLVCAVPLYSQVAMSAGLRGVINAEPENADIVVYSRSEQPTASTISEVTRHLNQVFQKELGPYLGSSQFSVVSPTLRVLASKPGSRSFAQTQHQMPVTGASM